MTQSVRLSRFESHHCLDGDRLSRDLCSFAGWHSAEAAAQLIRLSGFSELLVKLEISLTLSGEIDNSNVKRVEEVSA